MMFLRVLATALLLAHPGLPDPRGSGGVMGCYVNVPADADGYAVVFPERFAGCRLVADLFVSPADAAAPARLSAAMAAIREAAPQATVGTYLSSCLVGPGGAEASFHPTGRLSLVGLDPGDFASGSTDTRINLSVPAARAKMVDLTVAEVLRRRSRLLFSDNWANPAHAGPGQLPPWEDSLAYMRDLSAALHQHDVRIIANVAMAPGLVPRVDVAGLAASGVDGVALELSLLPSVASDPARLELAVDSYAALLDSGVAVILLPVVPDPVPGADVEAQLVAIEAEGEFLAGLALVLETSGRIPWVSHPFYRPLPPWYRRAVALGDPRGPLTSRDQGVLSRRFERGTVLVDCRARTVLVTFSTPGG
jgi:hypothetical protein